MNIKHKGVTVDLRKAGELTCICFDAKSEPFIFEDAGQFHHIPGEHMKLFVRSIINQVLEQKKKKI